MPRWLVHVDRDALPLWRSMGALTNAQLSEEVGEGFRIAQVDQLHGKELIRYAQPVEIVIDRRDILASQEPSQRLMAYARKCGAKHRAVFTIRRHGERAAAKLGSELPLAGFDQAGPDDPVLMISASDQQLFAGVVSKSASLASDPGGLPHQRSTTSDAISRARFKLRESLDWLALHDLHAYQYPQWLELGAYPGGMTSELVARGCRVIAVDLAQPSPSMLRLAGVEVHTADAHAFSPSHPVDAVLCDVNGPPMRAVETIARLVPHLRPGALVILTIKLPQWDLWPSLKPRVEATLTSAGLEPPTFRHLFHNRQELTALTRK